MAITFTPRRGGILMCDFGPDPADPLTFPLSGPGERMVENVR
jgi:hypothetical protein